MGVKIFLDDIRYPPSDSEEWIICRTAYQAKQIIDPNGKWHQKVDFVAFDHDLGTYPDDPRRLAPNGHDVAMLIERLVFLGKIRCPDWSIHSMNPVGVENIMITMTSAKRHERACDATRP